MLQAKTTWALPSFILFLCITSHVDAADVQSSVSTRETYVNLPFTLQIQINNAKDHGKPIIPPVDGLEIVPQGRPSRSYRTTIINGRTTQRNTLTYQYSVTATREGTFTIPAVKVVVDGEETETRSVRVVATQSETDDLMFVEIEGKDDEIYVGEALQLTLKIWVRAYRDQKFEVTLNEATMWSLISKQTQWGNFQEAIQEMAENRQRPGGRLTLREDTEGQEREYLFYKIDATVYPDRPGQIDGDGVRVILNYPEKLGRTRSPLSAFGDSFFGGSGGFGNDMFSGFGSQVSITSVRPIIAETDVEAITVKPIPEQGRPLNYRGAVGQYRIASEATPRTVKAGDPITLNIGIAGQGPMELLRAPPLTEQENLTSDFKVPNEPLAGFVDGTQKVFSTTLRPLKQGTKEIPGIEYSFFDPDQEQFVSIKSEPITINVEAAELLALDAIVGKQSGEPVASPATPQPDQQRKVSASEFPSNVLSSVARPNPMPLEIIVLFLLPPVCVTTIILLRNRHHLSSFVSAKRRFTKAMGNATTQQEISLGLQQFLKHRYRLPVSPTLQNQTVGVLRASGNSDIAIETERLYHECQLNPDAACTDRLRRNAESIVETLCKPNVRRAFQPQPGSLKQKSALALLAFLISPLAIATSRASDSATTKATSQDVAAAFPTASAPAQFSDAQITKLLSEAEAMYTQGMKNQDQSESNTTLGKAAERLQLLIDSGIRNDALFASLADAQALSGNPAKAVANYRRALRYAPGNQAHHDRLTATEAVIGSAASLPQSQLSRFRGYNNFVLRILPPTGMLALALIAWIGVWGLIAWRLISRPLHWKLPTTCLVLLAFAAFASYELRVSEFSMDNQAVVTQPNISLRDGDGSEFEIVRETPFLGGDTVQVLDQRGSWHKVKLSNGQSGWLPSTALQLI
ncbi:BatD family protein [Rhodopirellula sp.]|nr:BatD family protein [Rhodopirellula sp.]MDA7907043.1 BatD family protein [bacterium]MDB4532843.1 BatD family protein [bacterium]